MFLIEGLAVYGEQVLICVCIFYISKESPLMHASVESLCSGIGGQIGEILHPTVVLG
ncbi:hypothetical protein DPMN_139306 [Dreissena polymorpha]|uniref:Uncharacterized protein n=1 Tax=Dreissena polymorpha TaxID=45954 RepID=A0A9D4JJC3_DREPO|nr:hypothetical protein DPMN_139302 [Dreissena polymorpha]KAH3810905.1 hypothetical protein DPMN_139304 [Dreissena polymorpha]KAH3810907.1 hypothetical protein DPMN_139306 [Dreissena polymorpha]